MSRTGFSGQVFVGCMFIGIGLGLAFRRPDVGALLGLGIGFMLMSVLRLKDQPVEIALPSRMSGYLTLFLGLFLVVLGLGFILYPHLIYPYIVGFGVVALGLGFIAFSAVVIKGPE